ncbi:HlyD family secretion protein [Dehalobacterium formicoaceticum]|uniref:Efflux RND transporter periplasmic adaptor subunit n=1 Tax=Dehalobacterium formicoaceticum TaxID=51515 RepID=A0ABT1Y3C1_9FIRM|nr:efflux RND transporter periplasmic adaptor subunit [Dehalobacterium formicoaceticum]MCR6545368.1 efflux RND transporter periplasmic adaptor subunit [Dehalobacterium formicoaceticum]
MSEALKRHRPLGVLLILLLLTSLFAGACGKNGADAAPGGFDPAQGLVLQGNAEGEEVDLNTKIAGKISTIYVEEGQQVAAGDLIAEIDSAQLQAKKKQVEAQVQMAKEGVELQAKVAGANVEQASGALQAAQAQLNKAEAGARSQEIAQAKANYEMMEKTYERVEKLYEKGAIAAQKKDEAETQLKIAQEQYSLAQEGARTQDRDAAQGLVDQAAGALNAANAGQMQVQVAEQKYQEALAGLEEINSLIADTKILAPQRGTVTMLNCKEGELVSTGMIIATVADLKNISMLLNVYESDLSQVSLGQEVQVRFNALGDQIFPGTVKHIDLKPNFAAQKAANNQEDDVLAYQVKVVLTDLGEEQIYPGMTAYAQFIRKN